MDSTSEGEKCYGKKKMYCRVERVWDSRGRQRGQPGSYVIRETFRQGYYLHNLRDTFISEKRTFQAEGKVRGDGTVFF